MSEQGIEIFNRRETDRKLCKRIYEALTPWPQVISLVAVCTFWGATYFGQFQAQSKTLDEHTVLIAVQRQDINSLKQNYAVIDQKLDDIKSFLLHK